MSEGELTAESTDRVLVVTMGDGPGDTAQLTGQLTGRARRLGLEVVAVTGDGGSEEDLATRLVEVVGDGRRTLLVASDAEPLRTAATTAAARTGAQLWLREDQPGDDERYVVTPGEDSALDDLHAGDDDPWGVDETFYEQRKRALLLASLPRERFRHGLELGSSTGALAADLAARCERLLVLDASAHAVAAAERRVGELDGVRVEQRRVPEDWPPAPAGGFDLVVLSEVGYFLSPLALDALAERLREDLAVDGVLVLCHWRHPIEGWPLDGPDVHRVLVAAGLRAVVATYRDRDVELLVLAGADQLPAPAAG